jgi:hypothetical protein
MDKDGEIAIGQRMSVELFTPKVLLSASSVPTDCMLVEAMIDRAC